MRLWVLVSAVIMMNSAMALFAMLHSAAFFFNISQQCFNLDIVQL